MPLLIGVLVTNEERRAGLIKLVEEAGHRIASVERADVILSDAKPVSTALPAIVLSDETSPADNHLPSDASPSQIDAALRAAAQGLSVRIARPTPRRRFEELTDSATPVALTPRELNVIDAIGAGLSNKAIARELGISLHTVKFHIESLLRKLGAHTRAEAVAKALERSRKETVEL